MTKPIYKAKVEGYRSLDRPPQTFHDQTGYAMSGDGIKNLRNSRECMKTMTKVEGAEKICLVVLY